MTQRLLVTAVMLMGLVIISATPANAERIYTLNFNGLVSFDSDAPSFPQSDSMFSGLASNESITEIEFHPSNGKLYGIVMANQVFDFPRNARLCLINFETRAITTIATLEPARYGYQIDFHPMTNRLHAVLMNCGSARNDPPKNYSVDVNTGTVYEELPFAFAADDRNFGRIPCINGLAYRYVAGRNTATLFLFTAPTTSENFSYDALAYEDSNFPGMLRTVAGIRGEHNGLSGFDISDATGKAYLMGQYINGGQYPGVARLYSIDLNTGQVSAIRQVGSTGDRYQSVAVKPTPRRKLRQLRRGRSLTTFLP